MSTARVHSLQALKDVKFAVAEFAESVGRTLTSVDADINRITQWLSQDRPAHWKTQVRLREEQVATANADVTFNAAASTLTIHLTGTTAAGPFTFVLQLSQLTLAILKAG